MAVYLGRSGKSAEENKSTSLFRPLFSESPINVDRAQVISYFVCCGLLLFNSVLFFRLSVLAAF